MEKPSPSIKKIIWIIAGLEFDFRIGLQNSREIKRNIK